MQTPPDQKTLWNGPAGNAWVEAQALLDQMLQPMADVLIADISALRPGRVLDIGCGTGATTIAAARATGGDAVGVDISEPMLALARTRAAGARATFVCADAQTNAFDAGSFDALMSRFGVMFFDDTAAAFANLRRAARHGAALRFVVWRSAEENLFLTTAERAAASLLPDMPQRQLEGPGPGPFALADKTRTAALLKDSGWGAIEIRPLDLTCGFPAQDLEQYLTRVGPLGVYLERADDTTRRRVGEGVRAAFDPYVKGAAVRFDAACWMLSAEAR
ncbi:MAG: methyltransferase domain-containing protein [Hyphomonadaceae bacterium]|nr:methyltransferase domain-containing protein [Hyphomonadaceae bacterium]